MKNNRYKEIETYDWIECKMPLQRGGNDCGVYVLRYLEDFFNNELELIADWIAGINLLDRYIDEPNMVEEYRQRVRSVLEKR